MSGNILVTPRMIDWLETLPREEAEQWLRDCERKESRFDPRGVEYARELLKERQKR